MRLALVVVLVFDDADVEEEEEDDDEEVKGPGCFRFIALLPFLEEEEEEEDEEEEDDEEEEEVEEAGLFPICSSSLLYSSITSSGSSHLSLSTPKAWS